MAWWAFATTLKKCPRYVPRSAYDPGATFADAAAEYLRYIGEDRNRKASTVEDYRSIVKVHLAPAFGEQRIEEITVAAVEAFQAQLAKRVHRGRPITPRTRNKVLNVLSGIFSRARKVWGLPLNPPSPGCAWASCGR